MPKTAICSKYGLIGDDLELKKNISIEVDKDGKIITISCDNNTNNIDISRKGRSSLLVPGLINSHIHIGDSFAKEEGFNKDLIDVVAPPNGLKHKLLDTVANETKIEGIKKAVLEMLANGITFFVDFRENGLKGVDLLKKTLKNSPINKLILGRDDYSVDIETVFKNADGLGFPSYKHLSPKIKEKLSSLKKEFLKKIIACHDAEVSRNEPLFDEIINDNIIDVIIHGTHYTREDLERIKDRNISIVLCPRCNGYFGVGFPPINEINSFKIPVSLGTDNVMANTIDLFEEMRFLYRISRVLSTNKSNNNFSSKDLLKMVNINAAKNFGLENEFGSISVGKYADFFLLNLSDPNYYSYKIDHKNIYRIIVQRSKSENIRKTYIKGEVVFERK
jgi:cytosine/adenosine deaminase-related metal-dependent hydrolase